MVNLHRVVEQRMRAVGADRDARRSTGRGSRRSGSRSCARPGPLRQAEGGGRDHGAGAAGHARVGGRTRGGRRGAPPSSANAGTATATPPPYGPTPGPGRRVREARGRRSPGSGRAWSPPGTSCPAPAASRPAPGGRSSGPADPQRSGPRRPPAVQGGVLHRFLAEVGAQVENDPDPGGALRRLHPAQDDGPVRVAREGERVPALHDAGGGDPAVAPDERARLVVAAPDVASVGVTE